MSRLVKAIPAGSNRKGLVAQMASARGSTPAKEYWERVAKYIPSEIIAAFIAINCSLANSEPNLKYWLSLANLIMCAIFTPIYLGLAANKNEPKKTQQIVSFFAFIIWSYAISGEGGIYGNSGWHIFHSEIASFLIIAFSLFSGWIIPKQKP